MEKVNVFSNIDTKEKAYCIGFLLGDGHLHENDKAISTTISIKDKHVAEFIKTNLGGCTKEHLTEDRSRKKFPNIEWKLYGKKECGVLRMVFGGRLKKERHYPRISKNLEMYLLLGFFDAEGCITWGFRKDRDRLWQKVTFTSQPKMLEGIQKMLIKHGISTSIKPKGTEDCSILEFSSEIDVFRFMNILPTDCFRIFRKQNSFSNWLKETMDKYSSFYVGDEVTFVGGVTLKKYNLSDKYKVKTTKRFIIDKRYEKTVDISNSEKCYKNVPIILLSKKGVSNYALRLELGELLEGHYVNNQQPHLQSKEVQRLVGLGDKSNTTIAPKPKGKI